MDDVGFPWWIYLLFPGAIIVIALMAAIIIYSTRAKPVAGLGPRLTTRPDGTVGITGGTWNACLYADSGIGRIKGTIGATFGVITLEAGTLTFVADGEPTPRWSWPCQQLGVRAELVSVFVHAPTGPFSCTVSTEHINRISSNDLKSMRERRYARGFVDALRAWGARPL